MISFCIQNDELCCRKTVENRTSGAGRESSRQIVSAPAARFEYKIPRFCTKFLVVKNKIHNFRTCISSSFFSLKRNTENALLCILQEISAEIARKRQGKRPAKGRRKVANNVPECGQTKEGDRAERERKESGT